MSYILSLVACFVFLLFVMSQFKPFRTRRGIHHFFPVRIVEEVWYFFSKSSWGIKIVLVATICCIIGLSSPWIVIENVGNIGPFSLLCGAIGVWITLLLLFVLGHIFSYNLTQKFQKTMNVSLDGRTLFARVGYIILLMTIIVSICLTGAARSINGDIRMTADLSGLVMTLIGGILFCVGGYVIRRTEHKNTLQHLYVAGTENNDDQESYKKILGDTSEENMKLPI